MHASPGAGVKRHVPGLRASSFHETERPQSSRAGLGKAGANMEYRHLGKSGVKVAPICLGTMMFGGPTDEPTAQRIVASARERGVNFIDTADQYTDGRSEEVVRSARGATGGCSRPRSRTRPAKARTE